MTQDTRYETNRVKTGTSRTNTAGLVARGVAACHAEEEEVEFIASVDRTKEDYVEFDLSNFQPSFGRNQRFMFDRLVPSSPRWKVQEGWENAPLQRLNSDGTHTVAVTTSVPHQSKSRLLFNSESRPCR